MMKECIWIRPEDDVVINKWFVDYWVEYRELITSIYPDIHKEINIYVNNRLEKKKSKIDHHRNKPEK